MKIAISTDWHIDGTNLEATVAQAEAMDVECAKRGVELHLMCGDLFNRPMIGSEKASTGAVVRAALQAFRSLSSIGYHILLTGNHDKGGMSQDDALHVFDSMDNVMVAREPQIANYGGLKIYCLPWSWGESIPEDHIILSNYPFDIMIGHVEVVGSKMNGSHTCESTRGKWQMGRHLLESIEARHIALGHFHTRQNLCPAGGYVGAFMQQNFGEEENPAGFEIYDSETGVAEWIELDRAPKHRTYIVDEHTPAPTEIPEGIKARVRFVRGIDDRVAARKLENMGAQVEEVIEPVERVRRCDVRPGAINDKPGLMRLYAQSQNPPIDGTRLNQMQTAFDELIADRLTA